MILHSLKKGSVSTLGILNAALVNDGQDLVNTSCIPEYLGNFGCQTSCFQLSVKTHFHAKGLSYLSDHYKISPEHFILIAALILTILTNVTGNCKVPFKITK